MRKESQGETSELDRGNSTLMGKKSEKKPVSIKEKKT